MNRFLKISLSEIKDICIPLYKILIPFIFIIKILEEIGIVKIISNLFEPIVQLLGLPAELGIVWVTAIIINVYAAIILFINCSTPIFFKIFNEKTKIQIIKNI